MKFFNLDGSPHVDTNSIAPIVLIEKETDQYHMGWYFQDETEDMHGPFDTFEQAVELFKKYTEQL